MSKVSDMIKMYSQSNTSSTGPKPGASGVARKWPPVNTSGVSAASGRPPPTFPKPGVGSKPSALHPKEDSNIPPWKARQAETNNNTPSWKNRQQGHDKDEEKPAPWAVKQEENGRPPWARQQQDQEKKIPPWGVKREQQDKQNESLPPWSKPTKPDTTSKPLTWSERQRLKQQQMDNDKDTENQNHLPHPINAPKPNFQNRFGAGGYNSTQNSAVEKSSGSFGSSSSPALTWSERQKLKQQQMDNNKDTEDQNHLPHPINAPKPNFQNRFGAAGYNSPQNSAVEKSSGSFGSAPKFPSSEGNSSNTSGQRRVSALHSGSGPPKLPGPKPAIKPTPEIDESFPPPPSPAKPPKINGVPPRLKIPPEKYNETPPIKQAKPPNVVLPTKGKKKFSLPSLPPSFLQKISPSHPNDAQSPADGPRHDAPLPPPPGSRNLPSLPSSDMPPSLPARPGLPARPVPSPGAGKRSMPLPAAPIADDIYDDTEEPPPLPNSLPPPLAGKRAMPLPAAPIPDDIYDDTDEPPPPLPPASHPPPLERNESSGLIPTWDDESDGEAEAVYDDTPDEPPLVPRIPGGFPPQVPQIPEDGEEMYEDVEEYMRLKKLQQQPKEPTPSISSEGSKKDKKKNASEKKEKELRKKFRLASEGPIIPVGNGRVKESCKRGWDSKGLSVTVDEKIEVIRMTDNPKGKWLVRNGQGEYGYVDSDKVEIQINDLRSMMGVGSQMPSGFAPGPPVPGPVPPMIPTEDDEAIYDETADEDIYEEV